MSLFFFKIDHLLKPSDSKGILKLARALGAVSMQPYENKRKENT